MVHGPLPRMHLFQPRNFLGGQSSGPAGSDPRSFRPPMGISHPAVVSFDHKTARFVLSLFTRGGQVRTADRARTNDINVKDLEPINVIVCFAINVNVPVGGNLTLMTYGTENTYTSMCKVFPRHIDINAILCRH